MSTPHLFDPFVIRGVTLRNRIGVSPMCQYSADNGHPTSWHLVHLGSRAVGGAGLVFAEATSVTPEGRISPADTGLWLDSHAEAWAPCAKFIREQGAVAAIQLAHAGRKASTQLPWLGGQPLPPEQGGFETIVAPSALPFDQRSATPHALDVAELDALVGAFRRAAERALNAGFDVVEVHAAHGYLLHQFLSPLSNQRTDEYGGVFENRVRLLQRVVKSVREVWPERLPLFLRISATDWLDGGWDLEQSCALVASLAAEGVDLVDVSSGGLLPTARIPMGPGYQTSFAAEIRKRTAVATAAVGMISSPEQADHIVRTGQADVVLLAREMLRDPYFPRRAARALGAELPTPNQYKRAW
jgi:2,4-dienoyl-CoA reductase-like NADH-dependent reductase (Old Yellow Enzyme family)